MEVTPADVENLNPVAVAAMTYQPDAFDGLDLRSIQSPHRDAALKGYLVVLYTLDKEKGRDLILAFSLRPLSTYKDREVQRRITINITGLEDEVINRLAFLKDVLSARNESKRGCKRKCGKSKKSSGE
jgi:hypothetical protein